MLTGGNPDAFRQIITSTSHPNDAILSANFLSDPARTFTPSKRGAIGSIDMSIDARMINATFNGAPTPAGVGQSFVLRQNGNIYITGDLAFTDADWRTFSLTGLTAKSFLLLNGNATRLDSNPDFSRKGGTIEFGFTRSNTRSNNGVEGDLLNFSAADNFIVLLHLLSGPLSPPTTLASVRQSLGLTTQANTNLINQRLFGGSICGICVLSSITSSGASAPTVTAIPFAPDLSVVPLGESKTDAPESEARSAVMAFDKNDAGGRRMYTKAPLSPAAFADRYVPRWTAFAAFGEQKGSFSATANQTGMDFNAANAVIGLDRFVTPNMVVGASYGFGRVRGTLDGAMGTNTADSNSVAAHTGVLLGPSTYVSAIASQTWAPMVQNRTGGDNPAAAGIDTRATVLSATVGHDHRLPFGLIVGASGGLTASFSHIGSYNEMPAGGSNTAFAVPAQDFSSVQAQAGVRAALPFYRLWGTFVPSIGFGVSHELRDQGATLTLTALDDGTPMPTIIDGAARTRYTIDGGLGVTLGAGTQIGASVSHSFADGFHATNVSGRARMRF